MARVNVAVPKFTKLEAHMGTVPNGVRAAIGEVDVLMTVRRTPGELALLQSLRAEAVKMHLNAKAFQGKLMALLS